MTDNVAPESLQSFIARNQLEAKVMPCGANPNIDASAHMTRHFSVTITRVGFGPSKPMHLFFSQGSAHTKQPTLADVLDCLASDSASVENSSFEDWARALGYDTDSRKAEKTYRICQEQSDQLRSLLGDSQFKALLFETERL